MLGCPSFFCAGAPDRLSRGRSKRVGALLACALDVPGTACGAEASAAPTRLQKQDAHPTSYPALRSDEKCAFLNVYGY